MRIRRSIVLAAEAVLLCLALCLPSLTDAAGPSETGFMLTEQSLDSLRNEGLPADMLRKLGSLKDKTYATETDFLAAVRQALGGDPPDGYKRQIVQHAADRSAEANRLYSMQKAMEHLEQRINELEMGNAARDEATRAIIRDTLSKQGSKINEAVTLGGTLEVIGGWTENYTGRNEGLYWLSSAKIDLEIEANSWTRGHLIIDFDDGTNATFLTNQNVQTGIDRLTVDQAYFTIGDTQRFPLYLTVGKIVLPFGISTGNPVTDTLTIEDPLTIEGFEMRRTAIGIGAAFPTPAATPAPMLVTPPHVRPMAISPLIGSLAKAMGYTPSPAAPPTPVSPKPTPPLINLAVYTFNGETMKGNKNGGFRPGNYINATAGARLRGKCDRPYEQIKGKDLCPWSVDIDVEYTSSIFESRFLAQEYLSFLPEIGFVKGLAPSIKATIGPWSLVGEWNGALEPAEFVDSTGKKWRITPSAWQVSLAYQFDWNPWIEEIGMQGTYLAIGYSESDDLQGGMRKRSGTGTTSTPRAVGLARRKLMLGAGEWLLENLRFAIEYSRTWDYSKGEGRTGKTADGILSQLTLVF